MYGQRDRQLCECTENSKMDRHMERQMNGQTNGHSDIQTIGRKDKWTNK